jgi:hypothetical protein
VDSIGIAQQQVDRTDRSVELAFDHLPALPEGCGVLGEQGLQVRFNPVLLESRVNTKTVIHVKEDLPQGDSQGVTSLGADQPQGVRADFLSRIVGFCDGEGAGGAHPVQGLVRAIIRMHGDGTVGLQHDQPLGHGKMGCQSTRVVDLAVSNDETHG